jgi:sulfonate transport system permease protein
LRATEVSGDAALLSRLERSPPKVRSRRRRQAGKSGRLTSILLGVLVPLALLLVWGGLSRLNLLPQQILPPPNAVWAALQGAWEDGSLPQDILVSLGRVVKGFAAGSAAGVVVGVGFGLSPALRRSVEPLFLGLAQVPVLAWLPILILLAGLGDAPKIIAIAWAAFVPVVLNTAQGIRDVPPTLLELGRVIVLKPRAMLSTIILPAAVPQIFTGLREGLANGWQTLVAVELVGSFSGLGYMMAYARQLFQLDVVLAAVVVVGAIGFTLHLLLAAVERRLLRWQAAG